MENFKQTLKLRLKIKNLIIVRMLLSGPAEYRNIAIAYFTKVGV